MHCSVISYCYGFCCFINDHTCSFQSSVLAIFYDRQTINPSASPQNVLKPPKINSEIRKPWGDSLQHFKDILWEFRHGCNPPGLPQIERQSEKLMCLDNHSPQLSRRSLAMIWRWDQRDAMIAHIKFAILTILWGFWAGILKAVVLQQNYFV